MSHNATRKGKLCSTKYVFSLNHNRNQGSLGALKRFVEFQSVDFRQHINMGGISMGTMY